MVCEFVFTAAEGKKLIAKAVAGLDRVKKACAEGLVALHPSSSTYFIFEELTGHPPDTAVWVGGVVVPRGFCAEANTQKRRNVVRQNRPGDYLENPGNFSHTWVIEKGELIGGITVDELAARMTEKDIYMKGVNALDPLRQVGVLLGSAVEGTIGRVLAARGRRGFEILCPVGLEKLLPVKLETVQSVVNQPKEYAMGIRVRLVSFPATVVTEIDALELLADVKAVPFAKGGLAGAEGGVCIAVSGPKEEIGKAVALAESVKGARLPAVKLPTCTDCSVPTCHFSGTEKHWFG